MSMEWEPVRRVFEIFLETILFLLLIVQGLCAYALATFVVSDLAECGYLFSQVMVAGPCVSSSLARFFFSQEFVLLVLRAVKTQIFSTMFVTRMRSFPTIYLDKGFFRFRAMAILARLRKRTVPTFFKAVAIVSAYIAVFWPAFQLLHVPGQYNLTLMLLGAIPYFAGTVGIAVVCECRLACALPVLEDARDSLFGAMGSGLALIGAGKFCAAAAMFALLPGNFVAVAVLTAFPSQLAAASAINAVLCSVVAVTLVATPLLYLPMAVLTAFPWQALAAGTANNAVLWTVVAVDLVARPLLYLYLPSATATAVPSTLQQA